MDTIKRFLILGIFLFFVSACQIADPSPEIHLAELTIADIHEAYTQGLYNSQELVSEYISAIEAIDSKINAITFLNPNALPIAKALDEEYQSNQKLRPLHGIPIIIKDNINTKGLPTTAGSVALQSYMPEEDAFIINKLADAGAILLAKSNMAEWAFSPMHSTSSTRGTTRNPYNLEYVPAGSSGGTAAAVAANLATVGLGTDTGNSIRGPSSHNALVGFRTTLGLISREGIVPLYLRNDVVGPMCRSVEDATRVMEIMVGIDEKDHITKYALDKVPNNYTQFLNKEGLKGAKIGVLRELSERGTDPDIKALFEQAIFDMDSLGADIIDPVIIPNFAELSQDQWCATFREDLESFLSDYVKSDTLKTIEDIIKVGSQSEFASGRLSRNATNDGRWEESTVACLDAYHDEKRIAFREAIEKVMDSLQLDAIVYPSWNNIPARIAHFQEEYKGDNSQIISPHTGQPAFTVPMGFSRHNLPAGLQFLGRMFDEPTLIKLTYAYEQGTQHRKPPGIK